MQARYPDLDRRVRPIVARLGLAATVDNCRNELAAEGIAASRATVGRAVRKVRNQMRHEAAAAGVPGAQSGVLSPEGVREEAARSQVVALQRAICALADKVVTSVESIEVTTVKDIDVLTKSTLTMVQALESSRSALDGHKAAEAAKAEQRQRRSKAQDYWRDGKRSEERIRRIFGPEVFQKGPSGLTPLQEALIKQHVAREGKASWKG